MRAGVDQDMRCLNATAVRQLPERVRCPGVVPTALAVMRACAGARQPPAEEARHQLRERAAAEPPGGAHRGADGPGHADRPAAGSAPVQAHHRQVQAWPQRLRQLLPVPCAGVRLSFVRGHPVVVYLSIMVLWMQRRSAQGAGHVKFTPSAVKVQRVARLAQQGRCL